MLVAAIVDIFKYLFNKLEQKISAQKKHHCYLNMSLQCDILIFIFIELEPSIQRPISYTQKRIKFNLKCGILFQCHQHSLKSRSDTRKCHYGKKPCGVSLVMYLWACELAEFRSSSCFLYILKPDSSPWSIALSCLTKMSKMIRNKWRNHWTGIILKIKETKSVQIECMSLTHTSFCSFR